MFIEYTYFLVVNSISKHRPLYTCPPILSFLSNDPWEEAAEQGTAAVGAAADVQEPIDVDQSHKNLAS